MNIQGVQRADFHIRNSFSPLCKLADTVLFPHDDPYVSRFWTKQTASSASLKHGSSSDAVLHSVNKVPKKKISNSLPSVADQIPETIYTHRIHQDCELLINIGVAVRHSQDYTVILALLDSRANATFVNILVIKWLGLPLEPLANPIRVFNVDGTCNSAGNVTHMTTLTMEYHSHWEELCAEVMDLGKNSLILGYTWLKKHNPVIDWQTGTMKFSCCPHSCHLLQNRAKWLSLDEEAERNSLEHIHQAKVEAPAAKKPVHTPEELVPPCYHSYLDIFSKKAASQFLLWKPWDHAIDLKDMFKPKKGRLIPLWWKNRRKSLSSLMNSLPRGTSAHPNLNKPHPYSSCQRRTVGNGWCRTTDI